MECKGKGRKCNEEGIGWLEGMGDTGERRKWCNKVWEKRIVHMERGTKERKGEKGRGENERKVWVILKEWESTGRVRV